MDEVQLTPLKFSPEWIEFFALAGAILLVTLVAGIWFIVFSRRKKKKRKRESHGSRRRSPRTTLADTGGLPPIRGEEDPPDAT